jgi:osmotically inducible protein OsmC
MKTTPSNSKGTDMNAIQQVLYTAKTHTTGGREGRSQTSDGRLDVRLTPPGAKGDGTNPEQLFAAGWSSCFLSAIGLEAAALKIRLPKDAAVDAEVDLGSTDGEYFLQARLNVSLPGIDRETAQRLVDGAHRRCPYSKAVRGNINVETSLVDVAAAFMA